MKPSESLPDLKSHGQGATHKSHERISEIPTSPAALKFTEEGTSDDTKELWEEITKRLPTSDNKELWQIMKRYHVLTGLSAMSPNHLDLLPLKVRSLDDLEKNLIKICPVRVAILNRGFKDFAGLQHLLRAEDNVIEHIDLSEISSPDQEGLLEMVITSVSSLGLRLSSTGEVTALNEAFDIAIKNNKPIKLKTLVLRTKPDVDLSKLAIITKHIERLMIRGIRFYGIDQLLSDPTCRIRDLYIETMNAEWIGDVVDKGRSLRKLGLRVYYSTPIEFLTNPKCTLDGLEMRIDNTEHDLQEIASAIARSKLSFLSIELFDMFDDDDTEDIEVILKAVQTAPCLTHLILQAEYFDDDVITRIEEFLTNPDCKLKGFGLRGNLDSSFPQQVNYKLQDFGAGFALGFK